MRVLLWMIAAGLLGGFLFPPAVEAGGFSIFEQGAKAMGMAGAFTAQADDPSALFHNVGGLSFVEERGVSVGATFISSTDEEFSGLPPFPGPTAGGKLKSLAETVPHLYWVQPGGERWNFGLALNSPFGLKTEWEDPDRFAGRFINTEASMLVVDLGANLGFRLTDKLGIGLGIILRSSEIELNRRLPLVNPLTGGISDVAAVRLESDMEQGVGWQLGLLHRCNESFSWGAWYKSKLEIGYSGDARFTQIATGLPPLDALVAATLPVGLDLPVDTEIEFPDTASLGFAFALGPRSLLELDVNWAGWSSFDTLEIGFVGLPGLDIVRLESWEDSYSYRVGLVVGREAPTQWRFGFVMDESPQPTASVSPLLPDADRNGYTLGWGRRGDRFDIDLAVMYLDFEERENRESIDLFNGRYSQSGWLLAATIGL